MIRLFEKLTAFIPLILFVALITLVPIQTAYAATFAVNTTNDTADASLGDGICADASGVCSLQAATYEAAIVAGPHTITLPADTYTLSLGGGAPLPFINDVTLNGADATTTIIQAAACDPTAGACGHSHRVLDIQSGTVDINNVTIRHGADGGIYNAGTLTITDSIIANNFSSGSDSGGGIFNDGGTLSIVDSSITNNSNTGSGGGGLFNDASGTISIIQGSTFSGNDGSSSALMGGGLGNGGTITTIENSIFSENSASGDGTISGGLLNFGTIGTIQNSSISMNSTSGNGGGTATGGLLNGGTITTIESVTFSQNNGNFAGGIFNAVTILTIDNTTFSQNSSTDASGGGGIANVLGTITTIDNSTFVGNTGSGASAIYHLRFCGLGCSGSIGTISNTLVAGNTGGAACDFTTGTPSTLANNISNDASCGFSTTTPMTGIHVDTNLADNSCITPLPDGSCVETHALLNSVSNPAIDGGSSGCPDEREFPQSGANCDVGAYEIQIANLTAIKSNNVSGTGVVDTSFNWSILLANSINQATFTDGQTILSDQLPTTNISYGGVTTSGAVNVTNSGNIGCSITGGLLTCTASGGSVIFETGSSISTNISATASATGVYVNPTSGLCVIDPNNLVYETDETDNTCFDMVIIPGVISSTSSSSTVIEGDTTVLQTVVHGDELEYLTKTVDKTVATGGDTVTYTITAHNPKSIPLTQVVIYDVFDDRFDNVQLVSTTHGSGLFVERTLTVSGFTLQPDERAIIIVSAQITKDYRAGEVIPNAAILESPDASVHVSNLVLVGDDVTGNDGGATSVFLFPNELPSTGETPFWRDSILLMLALGGLLIATGTRVILRRRGHS
jgi:uncharacterized repeat protein (TIGR01451 family)